MKQVTIVRKNDKQLSLEEMQSLVGGRIERHPEKVVIDESEYEVIVNEEGLIDKLPLNAEMNNNFGLFIFGNAILIEGGLKWKKEWLDLLQDKY